MTRLGELKRGWVILVACTIALGVSVIVLPIYTAGVFMRALNLEYGWSFGAMSVAPALVSGIAALTAPIVGALIDKIGAKDIAPLSLAASAVVYVGLSLFTTQIWLFWLGYAILAVVGAGCATVTLSRILATQFYRARGAALAVAMAGIGVASALAPALIQSVIGEHGWRSAYLVLALVLALAVPVIGIPLRMKRMEIGNPNEGDTSPTAHVSVQMADVVRVPVFWMMAVIYPIISLAVVGMIVHFVPMMTGLGVATERAAMQAGAIGVAVIICRLLIGALIDRVFSPHVAAAAMGLSAAGLCVFLIDPVQYGIVGALAVGLATGAEFDLIGYMVSRYFGIRSFGKVYGWLYGVTILAAAASPLIWGFWADAAGTYQALVYFAIGALALATATFMLFPRYAELAEGEEAHA